jgi:hypothetical protein
MDNNNYLNAKRKALDAASTKLKSPFWYTRPERERKDFIFYDVTSQNLAEVYSCLGETYCLHLQGRKAS